MLYKTLLCVSQAQISNRDKNQPFRRVSARYYTDKNVTCINCNKIGHLSKSCSEPRVDTPHTHHTHTHTHTIHIAMSST